jgi:hypothetical protein
VFAKPILTQEDITKNTMPRQQKRPATPTTIGASFSQSAPPPGFWRLFTKLAATPLPPFVITSTPPPTSSGSGAFLISCQETPRARNGS